MSLVGRTIGSVRLVERLGAGGGGEVFLGIDEKLKRKVAVKAIRGEARLGDDARARLLREARVLSQLEHPNICRLYEYVQKDDSDFLILELVEGRTLAEVLSEEGVPSDAMDLAQQILQALVAAHSVSVVHRDLKPANIMVTDDRRVKVLDFGLARAVRGQPLENPPVGEGAGAAVPVDLSGVDVTVTRFGAVAGTPRYMSPEQARGERITAAGDIYSVGLVLQELFTGVRPLQDTDDVKMLYHKAMWGESMAVEGVSRPLKELIQQCKALDPKERPSAEGVLERLRWIAGAPARRVRKAVVAAFVILLAVASVVSTIGFVRARSAQRKAEQAAAEAESVASFLEDMLASADPSSMGRDVRVVDVLDDAAERIDETFADTPLRKAAVELVLGRTYRSLGDFEAARVLIENAVEIRERELGSDAGETVSALHLLGGLARDQGRMEEATETLRSVFDRRRESLGPDDPKTLATESELTVTLGHRRQFDEAADLAEDVLDRRRRLYGAEAEETLAAEHLLARIYAQIDRLDEAEALAHHAVEGYREGLGPAHPKTMTAVSTLSRILGFEGHIDQAEALIRDLVDQTAEILGPDHPKTIEARANLAVYLLARKEYEKGVEILQSVIEDQKRVLPPAHPSTLNSMKNLASGLMGLGRLDESRDIMRRRWELAEEAYGARHRISLECRSGLASVLLADSEPEKAEQIYREVLAARREIFGDHHGATLRSLRDLARCLRALGRDEEADVLDTERARLTEEGVTAG